MPPASRSPGKQLPRSARGNLRTSAVPPGPPALGGILEGLTDARAQRGGPQPAANFSITLIVGEGTLQSPSAQPGMFLGWVWGFLSIKPFLVGGHQPRVS